MLSALAECRSHLFSEHETDTNLYFDMKKTYV